MSWADALAPQHNFQLPPPPLTTDEHAARLDSFVSVTLQAQSGSSALTPTALTGCYVALDAQFAQIYTPPANDADKSWMAADGTRTPSLENDLEACALTLMNATPAQLKRSPPQARLPSAPRASGNALLSARLRRPRMRLTGAE